MGKLACEGRAERLKEEFCFLVFQNRLWLELFLCGKGSNSHRNYRKKIIFKWYYVSSNASHIVALPVGLSHTRPRRRWYGWHKAKRSSRRWGIRNSFEHLNWLQVACLQRHNCPGHGAVLCVNDSRRHLRLSLIACRLAIIATACER